MVNFTIYKDLSTNYIIYTGISSGHFRPFWLCFTCFTKTFDVYVAALAFILSSKHLISKSLLVCCRFVMGGGILVSNVEQNLIINPDRRMGFVYNVEENLIKPKCGLATC